MLQFCYPNNKVNNGEEKTTEWHGAPTRNDKSCIPESAQELLQGSAINSGSSIDKLD